MTLAGSAVAHGIVIALLVVVWNHPPILRAVSPGEASGHISTVLYAPSTGSATHGQTGHATSTPPPRPQIVASKASPLPAPAPATTEKASTDSPVGMDSLGEGDMRIALGSWFPRPEPDLHGLPHGFQGDVIVDVVIDEKGRIRDAQLVRGISAQVDQTVIATVERWQFTPAERNGTAIASRQELLFHYGPV